MFSIDHLGAVMPSVDSKIIQERERYNSIYNIVDKYIEKYRVKDDKCIIVGGNMGADLVLGNKRNRWDYEYTLYTEHSFAHANALVNEIDKSLAAVEGKSWSCSLRTVIPNNKYQLFVDERPLVTVVGIKSMSEETHIYDLILPMEIKSFDGSRKFYVLPLIFQLMDMYRTLYSPAEASDWESTMEYEKKMSSFLSKKQIKGGDGGDIPTITPRKREEVNNAIIQNFIIDNANVALIGEYALRILTNSKIDNYILQIIYTPDQPMTNKELIDTVSGPLKKIIARVIGSGVPVDFSYGNSRVMQDTRLSRISVKVGSAGNKKEIMYIYNISYDLVPVNKIYIKKGTTSIQVGDPFVIMRFLLIDIWIMRWIMAVGKADRAFGEKHLDSLINKFLKLRGMMENIKHDGMKIFNKNYIGLYENEILAQKKIMTESKKFGEYTPRTYFKNNGEYRTIEFK